jgi:DNA topoisomerase-3
MDGHHERGAMSTVIVAEKPSVARDIARVLGARRRAEGYLEGSGYVVTWALGHLVQFAEPNDYGPPWNAPWQMDPLPMLPETWKLKTVRVTASQFRVVRELLNDPRHEQIICATDAGREGEHIFRLIYEQARCHKPVQRLWISSLTDHAIRQGFRQLRPSSDFDALAQAARARAQADWLVGMNLTRAYTVHNGVLCTIGRVQTPTLAMVVARDEAIARFTRAFFYELVAGLNEGFSARYSRDGQTRIDAKEEAQRLHERLTPCKTGTVTEIEKKIVRHRPPSLYNLTDLQRDANRRFGVTAAQVLKCAQALYEAHKLITYPRTESRHLPRDMVEHLPGILSGLSHPQAPLALERLRQGHRLNPAYVDDTKLTDHHAIVPTGQKPPTTLSPALRQIYDLVVTRFVAIFLPHEVIEETTVRLDIGGETFIAKGSVELEAGWRLVAPRRQDGEPSERQVIPPLEQGQTVHVETLEVVEKATEPPRPYTDATLLVAMKQAGRELEDDALAEAMKASGLGTPATRAEMIERLIRSDYVRREGKSLRATAKGQALIGMVAEPLRSPELTATWEQRLQDIEERRDSAQTFYQAIVEFVRTWTPRVVAGAALSTAQVLGTDGQGFSPPGEAGLGMCPKCQQGMIVENARAYGCSCYRKGCTLTIWKVVAKKKLTPKQVQDLLTRGTTDLLKGFKSKAGKPFAARLTWDPSFKVVFDFESALQAPVAPQAPIAPAAEPEALTCPKCGQGRMIEGKKGYGCNRYRDGCDFVVWKEIAHKTLSDRQRAALIRTGRTGVIKGFKSRSGRRFAARLKLDDASQVVFDFS